MVSSHSAQSDVLEELAFGERSVHEQCVLGAVLACCVVGVGAGVGVSGIGSLLIVATFLLPFLFFFYVYRTQRHAMPLLGLIAVLANGVW